MEKPLRRRENFYFIFLHLLEASNLSSNSLASSREPKSGVRAHFIDAMLTIDGWMNVSLVLNTMCVGGIFSDYTTLENYPAHGKYYQRTCGVDDDNNNIMRSTDRRYEWNSYARDFSAVLMRFGECVVGATVPSEWKWINICDAVCAGVQRIRLWGIRNVSAGEVDRINRTKEPIIQWNCSLRVIWRQNEWIRERE